MSESTRRLLLIAGSTFLLAVIVLGVVFALQLPNQTTLTAAPVLTATRAQTTPLPSATPAPTSTALAKQAPSPPATQVAVTATLAAHGTRMVAPQMYSYRVVNVFPHDPKAFTQGLIYEDGEFYEGTGKRGQSTLRRVDVATGEVKQSHALADEFFGEGITELDGKIYQLTWQEQTGFVYDRASFSELSRFQYPTEGWGITDDGERLIVSDGTATLYFWDPDTLEQTGGVVVTLFGFPVSRLNELEYVNGEVFANVWQTNTILRIDPNDGQVTGVIDLSGLFEYGPPPKTLADVLNGIAYDATTSRLFVTGKYWPAVFEIELVEVASNK